MKDVKTVNPVSKEEMPKWIDSLQKRMDDVPEWLRGRDTVVAATGQASMFKLCCDCLYSIAKAKIKPTVKIGVLPIDSFTAEQARSALDAFLHTTDEEILSRINIPDSADGADVLIPKLALLCAVLDKTGIKKVQTIPVVGSCAGLAIDNTFWEFQYDTSSDCTFDIGDAVLITCQAAGNGYMKMAKVVEHVTSSSICSLFNFISYFDVYKVKLQVIMTGNNTRNEENIMMISRNNLKRILYDDMKI